MNIAGIKSNGLAFIASSPRIEMQYVGFANSTNISSSNANISIASTGRTAGDFCVVIDMATTHYSHYNGGANTHPVSVVPSGFTQILNVTSPVYTQSVDDGTGGNYTVWIRGRLIISRKLLDGSETNIVGMGAGGQRIVTQKQAWVFRPSIPIASVQHSTPTTQVTNGNPSPQVIDSSNQPDTAIHLGVISGTAWRENTTFSVQSPAFTSVRHDPALNNANYNNASYIRSGYLIRNETGVSQTIDDIDPGADYTFLAGMYFTFTPQ